jgi:hypothetical protein
LRQQESIGFNFDKLPVQTECDQVLTFILQCAQFVHVDLNSQPYLQLLLTSDIAKGNRTSSWPAACKFRGRENRVDRFVLKWSRSRQRLHINDVNALQVIIEKDF